MLLVRICSVAKMGAQCQIWHLANLLGTWQKILAPGNFQSFKKIKINLAPGKFVHKVPKNHTFLNQNFKKFLGGGPPLMT